MTTSKISEIFGCCWFSVVDYALTNYGREPETLGTTGFEPATYCSQSNRATKLRHVPAYKYNTGLMLGNEFGRVVNYINRVFVHVAGLSAR